MDVDLILGVVVIFLSFGFTTFLMLYSRRNIDIIADKELTTARQILKALKRGHLRG